MKTATPTPPQEVIRESLGEEVACPYLATERSKTRYRWIHHCTPETYLRLLERGWRRFGRIFFRPTCVACQECRSLRVDVARFAPNRSMRRTVARNQDLEVLVGRPSLSASHLELYNRFHADMTERKAWREAEIDAEEYYSTFVEGHESFGYEFLYFESGKLVCVALVDVLPRALSAVYCYYEPELRGRGLGIFSVLRQIELARTLHVPHLYLGYLVRGNPSMLYKARYEPNEILYGRPELDESPRWEHERRVADRRIADRRIADRRIADRRNPSF